MTTQITEKPKDDSEEHKLNRKDIIHLGFQNKTKGEAAFNLISYAGFGYGVVTGLSVFMTWLMNDKIPAIGEALSNAAKRCRLPRSAGIIGTLFIGGTIASVLPVKWLEDRKPKLVKKLDYVLYDEDQFYNDPKIQAAHKELDELPRQTWLSVAGSRVVAFGATLAVFLAMGSNSSPVAKLTGHSLDEASIRIGRRFDRWINRKSPEALSEIANAIAINEKKIPVMHDGKALPILEVITDTRDKAGNVIAKGDRVPTRVYSYITLDAFYTLITSITLWVSTRVFGAVMGVDAKKAAALAEQKHTKKAHSTPSTAPHMHTDAGELSAKQESPETRVNTATHIQRIAEPQQTAELTA